MALRLLRRDMEGPPPGIVHPCTGLLSHRRIPPQPPATLTQYLPTSPKHTVSSNYVFFVFLLLTVLKNKVNIAVFTFRP